MESVLLSRSSKEDRAHLQWEQRSYVKMQYLHDQIPLSGNGSSGSKLHMLPPLSQWYLENFYLKKGSNTEMCLRIQGTIDIYWLRNLLLLMSFIFQVKTFNHIFKQHFVCTTYKNNKNKLAQQRTLPEFSYWLKGNYICNYSENGWCVFNRSCTVAVFVDLSEGHRTRQDVYWDLWQIEIVWIDLVLCPILVQWQMMQIYQS